MLHDTLNFLLHHVGESLTPEKWCALLYVEIIDPDGWRSHVFAECVYPPRSMSDEISLAEFIARLAVSTIREIDPSEVRG